MPVSINPTLLFEILARFRKTKNLDLWTKAKSRKLFFEESKQGYMGSYCPAKGTMKRRITVDFKNFKATLNSLKSKDAISLDFQEPYLTIEHSSGKLQMPATIVTVIPQPNRSQVKVEFDDKLIQADQPTSWAFSINMPLIEK